MIDLSVMELTEVEKRIILEHRAQEIHIAKTDAFREKVLYVANNFLIWAYKEGYAPTFSTFVNDFEYQEKDCQSMYEAVKKIWDLVHTLEIPMEKDHG
jgi:hypothetical protein